MEARPVSLAVALRSVLMLLACAAWSSVVLGRPLTIANFGGANGQAQAVAFQKPFVTQHDAAVSAVEYSGDLAPIRAMVQAGKIDWDIAEVESADLIAGCETGLFERIDRAQLAHSSMMLPGAVHECGVGAFVWSTVMAYDAGRMKEPPRSWADFWDVAKYPGKRGMRKGARYNMEFALMADGVRRADVYATLATEQGVERALRKLEALRPHIVWWESGAQPPKMIASGEVLMSSAFNGRIAAANRDGAGNLQIAWPDAIYELDYWVILKGSPRRALAQRYINFVTSGEAQLAFSREIPYGPTNFNAIMKYDIGRPIQPGAVRQALIDLSMADSDLPSAPGNMRRSLPFNAAFWIQHGPAIEKRLAALFR